MTRYTPESYNQTMQDYNAADEVYVNARPRNAEELATRRIGDVERIAITLLERHINDGVPTFAQSWLQAVVNDTTFVTPSQLEKQVRDYEEYLDERDDINFSSEREQLAYARQQVSRIEAAINLADALVSHRLYGEPDIDTTTQLGFALAVTYSLASAIVSYCRSMMH